MIIEGYGLSKAVILRLFSSQPTADRRPTTAKEISSQAAVRGLWSAVVEVKRHDKAPFSRTA